MIVRKASTEDAKDIASLIHRSFGARQQLDPPADADSETVESVAHALSTDGGWVAVAEDGQIIGSALNDRSRPGALGLRRVSVEPDRQNLGVASTLVSEIELQSSVERIWLTAREELPQTVAFWVKRGYHIVAMRSPYVELVKATSVQVRVPNLDDTRTLAKKISAHLVAGDVVILSGDLGAGKTTFTQFLGEALSVRGPITSPTFVIARTHPSLIGGPSLVHVDAYRLESASELADLDLDASVDSSVTVIEWGEGLGEQLSDSWLHISLSDDRIATVNPCGPRWLEAGLRAELSG